MNVYKITRAVPGREYNPYVHYYTAANANDACKMDDRWYGGYDPTGDARIIGVEFICTLTIPKEPT